MSFDVDSLLDFDFDFSEISEDDMSLSLSEAPCIESAVEIVIPIEVVEEVSKINHKPTKSGVSKLKKPSTKRNAGSTLRNVIKGGKVPNISRRGQGSAVLCAFPTFDKCDSLVFLPHSISKFMNSGDISGMSTLLTNHAAKNCEVSMKGMEMLLDGFLYLNELITELHPDTVSCVNTTKVVGNTILATMFTKYTDSNSIFDCVARTKSNDPLFKKIFGDLSVCGDRSKRMAHKIEPIANKTEEEKAQMLTVAAGPGDMVVYANYYLKFTFDDTTRKVTHINYDFELTSLTSAQDAAMNRR